MDYAARLRSLGCESPDEPPDCDIEAIESAIGVTLPKPYRDFLTACGGWWRDIVCPCREPTPFGRRALIIEFHTAAEVADLLDSMITPREEFRQRNSARGHASDPPDSVGTGMFHSRAGDGFLVQLWSRSASG